MLLVGESRVSEIPGFLHRTFVVALLIGLSASAGPAWSLPVGRDDWFAFSSVQMNVVGSTAPLVDFTSGSAALAGRTASSASLSVRDPFAMPNDPGFSNLDNKLSVVRPALGELTFASGFSQSSLGSGAARGFGRLGWGDGQNTVIVTSAIGDIVTLAPGGQLDVNAAVSGNLVATRERIIPVGAFGLTDADIAAQKAIVAQGGECFGGLVFIVICSGVPYAFGVAADIKLTLGVWEYSTQVESPFLRFGNAPVVDCAGAVICQTFSFHDGVTTPQSPGTDEGEGPSFDERFSYRDTSGFLDASVPSSLSKGGGGKFYVGAQLSILLEPEVSEWGSEAGCLAGPWGQSVNASTLCAPFATEPALAFDMSHSLNIVFSGDASYTSQSGVFLSGQDVSEPGVLAMLGVGLAGLGWSRRKK